MHDKHQHSYENIGDMRASNSNRWYLIAWYLALFTIIYNVSEGVIAIWFGAHEDSLTLFGFGADSFIEVISGLGIAHMIWRIKHDQNQGVSQFEISALRVTGIAFYLLVITLIVSGIWNLFHDHKPLSSIPGMIISSICQS